MSVASFIATSSSACWNAARSTSVVRPTPAAPFASRMTESLVLSWPSTLMQLNESPTACFSIVCASSGFKAASVMMTHNIVAMFGAIMAAPLQTPLIRIAFPPMVTVAVACLGNVSVVIIARAAL